MSENAAFNYYYLTRIKVILGVYTAIIFCDETGFKVAKNSYPYLIFITVYWAD